MPPDPAKLLRAHVREHNIAVVAASGAALAVSAIGWLFLYGLGFWITMIATAVRQGVYDRPNTYTENFFLVAGVASLLAMFDAWLHRHEEAQDDRSKLYQLYEILLFFPRLTVAMLQNFTAWAWLPRSAVAPAVRLLNRLRNEHSVPVHELPYDIPNHRLRRRVLAVLEVTQLTDIRTEKGQLVLRWSALAPDSIRNPRIPGTAPEMPHARAREVEDPLHLPTPPERPMIDDRYDL